MPEEKEWYTSAEAAEYLKIPMHRLARLRREGRIQGVVGGGVHPRYTMYHINALQNVDTRDLRKVPKKRKSRSRKGAERTKEDDEPAFPYFLVLEAELAVI